jgi:hypothetical protein
MEPVTCALAGRADEERADLARLSILVALTILLVAAASAGALAWSGSGPLVIDHENTDISPIPAEWIDTVKSGMRMYYGHASHGEQVTGGLGIVEEGDPFYAFAFDYRKLPAEEIAFTVNDDLGVTPELFWKTGYGMDRTRAALSDNPTINIAMFMWCVELNTWTEAQVEEYFDSMEVLEAEFPHVTFVYATGNAQYQFGDGYNRWLRNEQIRAYCLANNKVLFDFADMDAWWYNPDTPGWEMRTYDYNGHAVPIEHRQYEGDEWGHTSLESCENKGKAMWQLTSILAGWTATSDVEEVETPSPGRGCTLEQNYPNPFNPSTTIRFELEADSHVSLKVYDATGRLVSVLIEGSRPAGEYSTVWNGRGINGSSAASGIYFYSLRAGTFEETRKMILLR